uniref:Retrovirus-related Pol polyprotein from transposon TNT 1-94 n=1 Tax=Tanacetum cinerariifolium TaxID=118510 RepID=A0A699GU40_TANCI|nr:retrovirus-related Pol polyprotein from transposon TNT 1-94 [Tanacetum cinerariifolium]
MPKALISDIGTHFCNKIIERPMKRYGVNHRFSTSYHPQTSGQVENTNKALKRILEKTVKDNPAIWSRKLDDALELVLVDKYYERAEKFKDHGSNVDLPPFANSSGLCAFNRDNLETPISLDKVDNAVRDCGKYVSIFLDTGSFPHGSNSSFSTLIPKLVVKFLTVLLFLVRLSNGSKKKKKLFYSKVDFEKAYDTKYNVYGIGVSNVDVSSMASNSGCASRSFPFTYLGLPVGSNMSLTSSWQVLLDRFQSKLSSWKANLLSIGGRHTLIKAIFGRRGIYYFSIFMVHASVLNSLERSQAMFFWSLKAFNLALLQKWRWRLLSHKNTLWVKVIKALHGQEGGFDNNGCIYNVTRARIIEINKVEDTCVWSLGTDGTFSVKDARCIIDLKILLSLAPSTVFLERWLKRSLGTYQEVVFYFGFQFIDNKVLVVSDFGLWKTHMRTLLIQHECEAALEVLPEDMEAEAKLELIKKAHNVVILCLATKFLREVTRETTRVEVWSKLEDLYMTKSLANRLYMKKKLYTFYMPLGRKISEHIDESNKIILDLENIKVKFKDEYLAFLLLTSLLASYKHFVDTYLYGQEALTLKDVVGTLNSKEIKKKGLTRRGIMVMSTEALLDWIIDSGGSYHLTPKLDLCFDFLECDRASVLLRNNMECRIRETASDVAVWFYLKPAQNRTMLTPTWELVDHPAGQKLVSCKWLFKIKEGIEGVQKLRYKARLVACGFTQRAGIDYNEVFSPVVRHTSIRVIFALIACRDYELEHVDVKTIFLHGILEEMIYMRQPLGYEQGSKLCLLNKSLYGLKQSPRQWYKMFDEYMLNNGLKSSSYDNCVYFRSYVPRDYIYLLLHVDDMLISCKINADIGSTNSLLKMEFDMKELGEAKKILDIVRDYSRKIMRVSQSGYVSKVLNNFKVDNGKSVKIPLDGHLKLSLKDFSVRNYDVKRMSKLPYENAVGRLMYLMVCTRPDIAYAVSVVTNYLANLGLSLVTHFSKRMRCKLEGNATTRGVTFNYKGGVYDPYRGCEGSYLAKDAIHLSRNYVFHERTYHINVHYHFIKEVLEAKTVKVLKVGTEHDVVDALTKVVPGLMLQHCLELLSVGIC